MIITTVPWKNGCTQVLIKAFFNSKQKFYYHISMISFLTVEQCRTSKIITNMVTSKQTLLTTYIKIVLC